MQKIIAHKILTMLSMLILVFTNGQSSVQAQTTGADLGQRADKTSVTKRPVELVEQSLEGSLGSNGWYTSSVTITFAKAGNAAGRTKQIADTIKLSTEGVHRIPIYDDQGDQAFQIIRIDKNGPVTEWIDPVVDAALSGVVELHTMSTDTVSYPALVEISVDGGKTWSSTEFPSKEFSWLKRTPEAGWTFDWDTTGLQTGSYVVLARAQDVAGNWGNTAQVTLSVDNSKSAKIMQEIPVSGAQDMPAGNQLMPEMSGTMGENGWYTSPVTINYLKQVGSILTPVSSTTIFSDGVHEVAIPDGNGGQAQETIRIDRTGPTTEWVDLAAGTKVFGVFELHTMSTDTVSYPAFVEFSFDGGQTWNSTEFPPKEMSWIERTPEEGWTYDWDTTGLKPGSYQLLARAQDAAGNWGNTTSQTVIVVSQGN